MDFQGLGSRVQLKRLDYAGCCMLRRLEEIILRVNLALAWRDRGRV
jgi:hypothetical protein